MARRSSGWKMTSEKRLTTNVRFQNGCADAGRINRKDRRVYDRTNLRKKSGDMLAGCA